MKIWFDTEFVEDGKTIDLISIGMVREDGGTYYAENGRCDHGRADPWVVENVLSHLQFGHAVKSPERIAREIVEFVGEKPEFWAYFCSYDWVVLCQLFGRTIDLPKGWPMWCRDLKQEAIRLGITDLPAQIGSEHHALADALWLREAWEYVHKRA